MDIIKARTADLVDAARYVKNDRIDLNTPAVRQQISDLLVWCSRWQGPFHANFPGAEFPPLVLSTQIRQRAYILGVADTDVDPFDE